MRHGVSFDELKTVFNTPFSVTIYDPDHLAIANKSAQGCVAQIFP
ncbi:MAG: BrnT family toxin [Syntrophaceae bacterium]|nr:BrnT family toxin [Syntrophaceae bacterium]